MQYYDRVPVWFGTHGVGAKPPSAAGLLRSLPRSLGDITVWPIDRYRRGCVQTRFDSPPLLSCADPPPAQPWWILFRVVWRSLEPPLCPRASFGAMRCAGKFSNTDGTVSPALREWVIRSILTSFIHPSYRVVTFTTFPIIVVGRIRMYSLLPRFPMHVGGPSGSSGGKCPPSCGSAAW
jgi:hypothetical protein